MNNKLFVGIDVSKDRLDVHIQAKQFDFRVCNGPAGFVELLEVCCSRLACKTSDLFFCFENTGRYSRSLAVCLADAKILFAMMPALEIKKSMGLKRGKSDRIDARAIAMYAWRQRDEIEPTCLNSAMVSQLRQMLALRDKLIRHRTAYKNSIVDLKDNFFEGETAIIKQCHERMIEALNSEISLLESQIETIIEQADDWRKNYRLIQTVKGIGPVLAKYLIIYSENFTRFNDPKKLACYAGIAPFEYSSGSSIKGRTRVHPCANKQLKSLLNIAAMSTIQLKGEYKEYYLRRTLEGKNKMSTLNIIRNKLVTRVFAVVKRQSPYIDLMKFAA